MGNHSSKSDDSQPHICPVQSLDEGEKSRPGGAWTRATLMLFFQMPPKTYSRTRVSMSSTRSCRGPVPRLLCLPCSSSCSCTQPTLASRMNSSSAPSCLIVARSIPYQLTRFLPRILKISVVVPFYAIFNFLSVVFPAAQVYLLPWLDFIQAIALGSFFLLLCEFVSPSEIQRDVFFSAMTVPDKKSGTGTRDGLVWFRVRVPKPAATSQLHR